MGAFYENTDYDKESFSFGDVNVEVYLSNSATTDYDLTGQVLWPSVRVLCHFMVSPEGRKILSGALHVLELGSGVGLTGIVASMIARKVTLSDHIPLILELIERNIVLNSSRTVNVPSSVLLDWTNPSGATPEGILSKGSIDVIMASDCVYGVDAVAGIVETLDYYLSPGGVCIMSYKIRWLDVDRTLRESLAEHGYLLREVPLRSFMEEDDIAEEIKTDGFMFLISKSASP